MAQPAEDRRQRIERIRREIAGGTYETPAKLEAALDAMLRTWSGQQADGEGRSGADD